VVQNTSEVQVDGNVPLYHPPQYLLQHTQCVNTTYIKLNIYIELEILNIHELCINRIKQFIVSKPEEKAVEKIIAVVVDTTTIILGNRNTSEGGLTHAFIGSNTFIFPNLIQMLKDWKKVALQTYTDRLHQLLRFSVIFWFWMFIPAKYPLIYN
jgi:hypothetical protein